MYGYCFTQKYMYRLPEGYNGCYCSDNDLCHDDSTINIAKSIIIIIIIIILFVIIMQVHFNNSSMMMKTIVTHL